jgi:hypothetical protein
VQDGQPVRVMTHAGHTIGLVTNFGEIVQRSRADCSPLKNVCKSLRQRGSGRER